jgi:hypothetical protein
MEPYTSNLARNNGFGIGLAFSPSFDRKADERGTLQ